MKMLGDKDIAAAKQILDDGGIVSVPTETVYGLAASLNSEVGIEKLLKIKQRPVGSGKILTVMVRSVKDIEKYAVLSKQERALALHYFPGELTMIFEKRADFDNKYFNNFNTIGIRIPEHAYMLKLLEKTGPLVVTSANPRGEVACRSSQEVKKRLPAVDAVVRGKSGLNLPSTILDIRSGIPHILRQGGLLIVHYS
jgi:L-threonylcarbamoyladenylate synthase